ncbi:MAG: methionyl-tRNA formyltransferase [Burkholderiales bacterium]|nr:methionyl-tRNA formyltransferase [Burkholderiales bacterium]
MRVAFAGTPEFAAVALQAILHAGHQVVLVLCQPDRPAGRGMKLHAAPVKQVALDAGLTLAQPLSLRLDGKYPDDARAAQAALTAAAPDVLVVAAYGLILPAWTLALPRLGCLNIHASLLPRWRGAAPIHRAIEAGDSQTGITIMQMDAGLDTGDMLLIGRQPIHADDSTASLHDRLARQGGELIVDALRLARAGQLAPTVQPEAGVCYAHKIAKSESALDWQQPADLLARRVRAFDPAPGASFQRGDMVCKAWAARSVDAATWPAAEPGTVLAAGPAGVVVACGSGALQVTELQRPGGKRLGAREFLAGCAIAPGECLLAG